MSDSRFYKYSQSKPAIPPNGIRAKTRRGSIGTSWWSRRFIDVMESIETGGRLARGRSYARTGNVIDLTIGSGMIHAKVQGTEVRPYSVSIGFHSFTASEQTLFVNAIAHHPLLVSSLLAGTMPEELDADATALGLDLFPLGSSDLRFSCTCPDWGDPCKHGAAVLYLFAERLDAEPFALLELRGMTRVNLIGELLRNGASMEAPLASGADSAEPPAEPNTPVAMDSQMERFYQAGGTVPLPHHTPGEHPTLELLDHSKLNGGASSITFWLAPFYRALAKPEDPLRENG